MRLESDSNSFTKKDSLYYPALNFFVNLQYADTNNFEYRSECFKNNFARLSNVQLLYLNPIRLILQYHGCQWLSQVVYSVTAFFYVCTCIWISIYQTSPRSFGYPPWITKEVLNNIKLKTSVHKNYKKRKTIYHLQTFQALRILLKFKIKTAYAAYMGGWERCWIIQAIFGIT